MKKQVILCVDDEPLVLESLSREIESAFGDKYQIELAENGIEALELLKDISSEGSDVPTVIIDYIMPKMKGDELLKEIHFISPETRKIMLTGQATMDGVTNAVNWASLYRYIAKPWEKNDLIMTLKEAIKSYDTSIQLIEKNKQLKIANEKLIKLDSAKTYFLGLLSHELTTPLMGINGNAKLIQAMSNDSDIQESCYEILESEKRLRKISELSLLITSMRTSHYSVKTQPEPIGSIVDAAILCNNEKASQRKVSFVKSIEKEDFIIEADYSLLLKALGYVLDNAVKFSAEGAKVYINGQFTEKGFTLQIIDSGPGFSAKSLENPFEPFVSGELMSHSEGVGLSLAALKVIMEVHNFDIAVRNSKTGGAIVEMFFPV